MRYIGARTNYIYGTGSLFLNALIGRIILPSDGTLLAYMNRHSDSRNSGRASLDCMAMSAPTCQGSAKACPRSGHQAIPEKHHWASTAQVQ